MKTLRLVVNMLIALFLLLAACSVNLTPTETPPSTSIVKNRPSKQIQPPKVAPVEGIAATSSYIDTLVVTLMPTSSILSDKAYSVELLEKGKLRAIAAVSWNQPEINVLKSKEVLFSLSSDEYAAYYQANVGNIFTVQVLELPPALKTATLKDRFVLWEITLNSSVWSGEKISVILSVTNRSNVPADFPYDDLYGGRVVTFGAIDSLGKGYSADRYMNSRTRGIFDEILPGETRTFSTSATFNSMTDKVTLYVQTDRRRFDLLDLEPPK